MPSSQLGLAGLMLTLRMPTCCVQMISAYLKALPKGLVKDEEEGVANAAGKDEQPGPRNYKRLAVFFMSVALVSVSANAGLTIAIVTKSVGAYTQKASTCTPSR